MIGRISGILQEFADGQVLVDVNGVGYEVEVTSRTLEQLPPLGETVVLTTHFIVREDVQQLYGFLNRAERDLFRALIRVSGVGPKLGLAVLAGLAPQQIAQDISQGDASRLVKISGIGKKTAERLVIDLKDRLPDFSAVMADSSGSSVQGFAAEVDGAQGDSDNATGATLEIETEQALIALGYKPAEATRLVAGLLYVDQPEPWTVESLLKAVLQEAGRVKAS